MLPLERNNELRKRLCEIADRCSPDDAATIMDAVNEITQLDMQIEDYIVLDRAVLRASQIRAGNHQRRSLIGRLLCGE